MANWSILANLQFRREVGIELEGYDNDLLSRMPLRSSDTAPPRCWIPEDPGAAIARGEPVVYVLVHPRHWRVARSVNARDNLARLAEGAAHRLRWIRPGRPER